MTADGLVTMESAHSFEQTLSRAEAALRDKDITIFARMRPQRAR